MCAWGELCVAALWVIMGQYMVNKCVTVENIYPILLSQHKCVSWRREVPYLDNCQITIYFCYL